MHFLGLNYDVLLRTLTFLDVTSIMRCTEVRPFHSAALLNARVPSHIFSGLFCFSKAGAVEACLAGSGV
jgi:hypothetical protein